MKKSLIVLPLALAALAGCTTLSTDPDEMGLTYNAGSFSATKYDACYGPSTLEYDGPGDQHYNYPAGQRTYKFSGDGRDVDGPAIKVVSSDNQELTIEGTVIFTTTFSCAQVGNTGKANLQVFHENIGLKYRKQYGDSWWDQMMDTYIKGPSDRAADRAAQEFKWLDLYNNPTTKAAFEKRIAALAPELIGTQAGGEYFKILSVSIQKPEAPGNLKDSLAAREQAILDNDTQARKNATVKTELDSIKDVVAVLGADGYVSWYQISVLAKAIEDGKVTVIPLPVGSDLIANPR